MQPKLAIILCTKNGERFLNEQLDSIENQDYKSFDLFISDDSSSDRTLEIIHSFKKKSKINKIFILEGPSNGFALNFMKTLNKIKNRYDYFAFSDQDDIWLSNKIRSAVDVLRSLNNELPNLYCSRAIYINEKGNKIGMSPLFNKPPSFRNALVQSIAGGNTMVFNSLSAEALAEINLNFEVISHDWLLYQIVSGSNGKVIYDQNPKILYRQHSKNIIGSNNNLLSIFNRVLLMLRGEFAGWIKSNEFHLERHAKITAKNKLIIESFKKLSSWNIFERLFIFFKIGLYRQTLFGNVSMLVAVLLRKLR